MQPSSPLCPHPPQRPDVIAEDYDLVSALLLVEVDQELAGAELFGVHRVQQLPPGGVLLLQVLAEGGGACALTCDGGQRKHVQMCDGGPRVKIAASNNKD